jgi:hypothetical protein
MGNNFGKQIRKKRPAAVRIHIDVWLDQILRFLTRLELYNLQFANRRLNRLIEIGTVKKLLRQKLDFHQLTFAVVLFLI